MYSCFISPGPWLLVITDIIRSNLNSWFLLLSLIIAIFFLYILEISKMAYYNNEFLFFNLKAYKYVSGEKCYIILSLFFISQTTRLFLRQTNV